MTAGNPIGNGSRKAIGKGTVEAMFKMTAPDVIGNITTNCSCRSAVKGLLKDSSSLHGGFHITGYRCICIMTGSLELSLKGTAGNLIGNITVYFLA